jgi:hypothetical protein
VPARLVEMMRMTADSLRLTAYGPNRGEIRVIEDLPRAETPHEAETIRRQAAAVDAAIDRLVYELYG